MQRIIRDHFLYIYIAYVNHPNDIKARSALIMSRGPQSFNVFRITSRFPNQKSKIIGKNYFIISRWQKAGLSKPSCVDTTRMYKINSSYIMNKAPIGRLMPDDIERLFQFLINKRSHNN